MVRCARCSHAWTERPVQDEPAAQDESKTFDYRITPTAARPIPPGSNLPVFPPEPRSRAWMGWLAAAVVVLAVVGGGIVARDSIIAFWPPAERYYAMVGLVEAVEEGSVFELRNVQQSTFIEDDRTVVVITGEIANVSQKTRKVPQVIAQVFDKNNQVLKRWEFAAVSSELGPGETTVFSDRIADPPPGAVNLLVSLKNGV